MSQSTSASSTGSSKNSHKLATSPMAVIAISLMLFSMFFGAGNLIFPPVVGADSGSNFVPAISGFLLGAVALPVIAIIAVALSGKDILDMGARGGKVFNIAFAVASYLAIGAFYAIPRTGAVSFSTAITPVFGWESHTASILFNLVFFGVAFALSINPAGLVDKLGKILTPILLALLALLIVLSLFMLPGGTQPAKEKYAEAPAVTGLLEGYMTMDSIAALAFGILVISALRASAKQENPNQEPRHIVKTTAVAAGIAGGLLALVYVGLGLVGHNIPDGQSYEDGAGLLSSAANLTMGTPGQVVLGVIVLLACMTTAVGLLAATSEFFNRLLPGISYKAWITVFSLFSFVVASAGLSTVLSIAAPIITFLYPVAITVVMLTILDKLIPPMRMQWGFFLGAWASVIVSAIMVIAPSTISWLPLSDVDLGWILPVVVCTAIGLIYDNTAKRRSPLPA